MPTTGAPPATLVEQGRVLAERFRADALLGRGGMGEVWRCRDLEQRRDVAVKVVRPEVTAESWAARLFHGEVVAMARLAHPAIIPIYDFMDEPGLGSFFVMEFRPGGRALRELAEPPSFAALRELFDDLLAGLGYAHAKGILHLDVKPENVLVQARGGGTGGALRPTLLDFGIARLRRAGGGIERWTERGEVLGTVAYMAPEQLSGELGRMGRWTDLYALGTMIYELVAGRVPFVGDDPVGVLMARLMNPAPPLVPRTGYEVPEGFSEIIAWMLATEPHLRPRFAADVRAALRRFDEPGGGAAVAGTFDEGRGGRAAALDELELTAMRAAAAAAAHAGAETGAVLGAGGAVALSGDPIALWLRTPPGGASVSAVSPPAVPPVTAPSPAAASPGAPAPDAVVGGGAAGEKKSAPTRAVLVDGPQALALARTLLAAPVTASRGAGTVRGPRLARDAADTPHPSAPPGAVATALGEDSAAARARHDTDATLDEGPEGEPVAGGSTGARPSIVARVAATHAVEALAAVADAEAVARTQEEPPVAGSYGLYGLRDLPLLGRFAERQATWEVVRDAYAAGLPRVVLLEGPAGVGKSRLARDVIERGEQLGVLEGFQTWWSAKGSGDEGLRGLVENTLDCRGAPVGEVQDRLEFWLAGLDGEHDDFTRDTRVFLRPPPNVELDAGLPLRVARQLVERAALRRPVLLWLDDVQWGRDEALPLVNKLLAHDPPLPVCIVASVRSDESPPAGYADLRAHARARAVPMAELDIEATRVFIRGLLDVDDHLLEFLAGRAEGNPLFAAQLLHQMVEADAFEYRDGRYRVAKDFDLAKVPATIDELWARRVARTVPGAAEQRALRTLALVRERLSPPLLAALRAALSVEDRPTNDAALRAALAAGLLRDDEGTLTWAHGLLRDHLVRAIPEADRAPAHVIAATALEALRAAGEDVDEERAHHLRAAERFPEAVAALRSAIGFSRARSRMDDLLARAQALLDWSGTLPLADPGPHRALALAHLARLDHMQGRLEEAERRLDEAMQCAGPRERLEVLTQRATLLRRSGRSSAAIAVCDQLEEEARALTDLVAQGRAFFSKSECVREMGQLDDAAALLERAREAFIRGGDERLAAWALRMLGLVQLLTDRRDEAETSLEEARATLVRFGDAQGEMLIEADLASLGQARGEQALLFTHMRRALRLAEALGVAYLIGFARLNLALAEASGGDYAAAAEHLRVAERTAGALRAADLRTTHAYATLEVAAATLDETEVREALDRAVQLQREAGVTQLDFPSALERGAHLAADRGLSTLGRDLLREARHLWERLGRGEDVRRLDAVLSGS